MNYLIITLLVFLVYWKLKNQYYQKITTVYSYKFYDLRDKIRDMAVSKMVNTNDWRFKYLDSSISKTIDELPYLNIYMSTILYFRYRDKPPFKDSMNFLAKNMRENNDFYTVYEEYGKLIWCFMIEKMIVIKLLVKFHIISTVLSEAIAKRTKRAIKKITDSVRIAPETSTMYNYC